MALQKFRDKQKLIYWIVAIIVIPSFMIFGYSQVFDYNPDRSKVGEIDNKIYSYQDFSDFYRRIQAVNSGQPVYFTVDGQNPWLQDSNAMFIILALRDKALKRGIIVTDDEVATYIKGQFGYKGESAKELEDIVSNVLQKTSSLKSVYEYKKGVRDWLLVKKFLNVLDNTIFFPESFANITNTMHKTSITYGELNFPVADFTKVSQEEFNNLSEAELKNRAEKFIAEYQKIEYRRKYPFLWTDAKWKFEYISIPLIVESLEPEVNDELIANYFKENIDRYKDDDGKTPELADIKDKVTQDYLYFFRIQTAQDTFGNEYNRFLNRLAQNIDAKDVDKNYDRVSLADIGNDARLKERGLTVGTTGKELLTAFEIANDSVFTGSGIQYFLTNLDNKLQYANEMDKLSKNTDATKKIMDEYSKNFKGYSQFGMDLPFTSKDKILSKVRLIDYKGGSPRKLTDKDSTELLASIKEAMIANRADNLAKEAAEKSATALKEQQKEIDGKEVKTNEGTFASLYDERGGKLSELSLTAEGETFGPVKDATDSGYSMYVVYKRDNDSISAQNVKPVSAALLSTYYRGNSQYQPEFPMPAAIKVGARLSAYITTELANEKFYMNNN